MQLPVTDYNKALVLQHRLVASRQKKPLKSDLVLLVEHPAVFTLGRRGGLSNLIVSPDYLKKKGIAVVPAERGGDITFHDIGQLIAYPIVNLRANRLSVTDYVSALEDVMIGTAAKFGVTAVRRDLNRGVWVGVRKLGSIGIAIRHGITFHGLAFNVNLSLTPFDWIRPCGLHNVRITSLARELSQSVNMEYVREILTEQLESVFKIQFQVTTLESLP
ncbi:lipoyl(octanoyl) transferase LipB [Desulfococcaceae bacterium HSG7]|nr:lipoyl(octanoyl) transferase LipB [Desulfococcaceae bacterium HSG7]